MVSMNDIHLVRTAAAFSNDGNKVGRVGDVYVDDVSSKPAWVTISAGLFGTKTLFAPLAGATLQGDRLVLAYGRDVILGAPTIADSGHISESEQQALIDYFTEHLPSSAPVVEAAAPAYEAAYEAAPAVEGAALAFEAAPAVEVPAPAYDMAAPVIAAAVPVAAAEFASAGGIPGFDVEAPIPAVEAAPEVAAVLPAPEPVPAWAGYDLTVTPDAEAPVPDPLGSLASDLDAAAGSLAGAAEPVVYADPWAPQAAEPEAEVHADVQAEDVPAEQGVADGWVVQADEPVEVEAVVESESVAPGEITVVDNEDFPFGFTPASEGPVADETEPEPDAAEAEAEPEADPEPEADVVPAAAPEASEPVAEAAAEPTDEASAVVAPIAKAPDAHLPVSGVLAGGVAAQEAHSGQFRMHPGHTRETIYRDSAGNVLYSIVHRFEDIFGLNN